MRIATLALSSVLTGCCFSPSPSPPAPSLPSPPSPTPVIAPVAQPMPPPPASVAMVRIELNAQSEETEVVLIEVRVVVVNGGAVEVVDAGMLVGCSLAMPSLGSLATVRCVDEGAVETIEIAEREMAVVVTRHSPDDGDEEVGRVPLGSAHAELVRNPIDE